MGVEQRVEELHDHIPELPREVFEEREPGAEPGIVGLFRLPPGEQEVRGGFESLGELRERFQTRLIRLSLKLADLIAFRTDSSSKLALAPALRTAKPGEAASERFRWRFYFLFDRFWRLKFHAREFACTLVRGRAPF